MHEIPHENMSILHEYRMEYMKESGTRKKKGRLESISPATSSILLPPKEPPGGA